MKSKNLIAIAIVVIVYCLTLLSPKIFSFTTNGSIGIENLISGILQFPLALPVFPPVGLILFIATIGLWIRYFSKTAKSKNISEIFLSVIILAMLLFSIVLCDYSLFNIADITWDESDELVYGQNGLIGFALCAMNIGSFVNLLNRQNFILDILSE